MRLLLTAYAGVTLICALIYLILVNILTSNAFLRYYLAMYDGKVVDEVLGEMPDHVKDSITRLLMKHGRSNVENCKKSIKDYAALTIIVVLPSVVPILNIVILVQALRIYPRLVGLYYRAKEYVNREVVN